MIVKWRSRIFCSIIWLQRALFEEIFNHNLQNKTVQYDVEKLLHDGAEMYLPLVL